MQRWARAKTGELCELRPLCADDAQPLGDYFAGLSADTRRRFGPHPLDHDTAYLLCQQCDPDHTAAVGQGRWVLWAPDASHIIGYVILEARPAPEEIERFAAAGVNIGEGRHWRFAPSLADAWQNRGLATSLMRHVIAQAQAQSVDSLVLMGGTQSTNAVGVRFYQKCGFQHVTSYWTEIENYDMWLRREDFAPLLDGQR